MQFKGERPSLFLEKHYDLGDGVAKHIEFAELRALLGEGLPEHCADKMVQDAVHQLDRRLKREKHTVMMPVDRTVAKRSIINAIVDIINFHR